MASSENPEKTLDNLGYVLKNNGPTQEDNTHERDPVAINNCNLCKECPKDEREIDFLCCRDVTAISIRRIVEVKQ